MAGWDTYCKGARWPAQAPPKRQTLESLRTLRKWRQGSVATAIVCGPLVPFAVALHAGLRVAIVSALFASVLVAVGSHLAREIRLTNLAIHPEFAQLPELARKRGRLVSTHNRRALARELRQAAALTQPPPRFNGCQVPLLRDRVVVVRSELLEVATGLEHSHDPDPTRVALVHELLRDGGSPLYNPNVPVTDLLDALRFANPPSAEPKYRSAGAGGTTGRRNVAIGSGVGLDLTSGAPSEGRLINEGGASQVDGCSRRDDRARHRLRAG